MVFKDDDSLEYVENNISLHKTPVQKGKQCLVEEPINTGQRNNQTVNQSSAPTPQPRAGHSQTQIATRLRNVAGDVVVVQYCDSNSLLSPALSKLYQEWGSDNSILRAYLQMSYVPEAHHAIANCVRSTHGLSYRNRIQLLCDLGMPANEAALIMIMIKDWTATNLL